MKLNMTHLVAPILFSIIIALVEVHGRTLMTPIGQKYECVDFYKQPAFDHLSGSPNKTVSSPEGSVPILISTGEPRINRHISARDHCVAVVRTNTDTKFYGSGGEVTLYKPKVGAHQWSSARIKLSNGGDSIEVGWIVYPEFFKDDEAHLYAKYKAGATECLNLNCPGFVQTSKDILLGSIPSDYTQGRRLFGVEFSIDKHNDDGNWWLSMISHHSEARQIGYWPSTLFTNLKDAASKVEWGGEINDPGAAEPAPAMGSSKKAVYDQSVSASFQRVTIIDERFNKDEPHGTEKYYDCPELYTVLDAGHRGYDHGRIILFGGSQ